MARYHAWVEGVGLNLGETCRSVLNIQLGSDIENFYSRLAESFLCEAYYGWKKSWKSFRLRCLDSASFSNGRHPLKS